MNHNVAHGIFAIERTYAGVTPQRVFDAFASVEGKRHWFAAPSDRCAVLERTMDFRVGGRERLEYRWDSGLVTRFDATLLRHRAGRAHRLRVRDAHGRAQDLRLAGRVRVQTRGRRHEADHDGTGRVF